VPSRGDLLSRGTGDYADWLITDRVVEVDAMNRRLLYEAATDGEVVAAFEACGGELVNDRVLAVWSDDDGPGRRSISGLVRGEPAEPDGVLLSSSAIPILLGMIVMAVIRPGVTYRAQTAWLEQRPPGDAAAAP
jgi:hypothetical protein